MPESRTIVAVPLAPSGPGSEMATGIVKAAKGRFMFWRM